jgi:hypothetical protein
VPRRKAVAFLNYIYEETHPLLPATPRATETLSSTRRRIDPPQKSAKESADTLRPSTSRQRGKAAPHHKSVNLMRNAAAASHSQAEAKTTSISLGKAGAKSQPIAQARAESEEEGDDLNSSQDSQASQVGDLHFHAQCQTVSMH